MSDFSSAPTPTPAEPAFRVPTPTACDALIKVGPDEPIFVLRASDRYAPSAILHWANDVAAARGPCHKTNEAMRIAHEMLAWQLEHGCKVPD